MCINNQSDILGFWSLFLEGLGPLLGPKPWVNCTDTQSDVKGVFGSALGVGAFLDSLK